MTFPWDGPVYGGSLAQHMMQSRELLDIPPAIRRDKNNVAPFMNQPPIVIASTQGGLTGQFYDIWKANREASPQAFVPNPVPPPWASMS